MSGPLHIGLPGGTIDSIVIAWPSGQTQCVKKNLAVGKTWSFRDSDSCIPASLISPSPQTIFHTPADTLKYLHQEWMVNDFKVQPLIPNMVSYHGPETASGDVNADGLEDFYICGPEGQAGMIFLQLKNGAFIPSNQPALLADARYEDTYAAFFDADGDKDQDLYVVSGGYGAKDSGLPLQDRLYLNKGGMFFAAADSTLPALDFAGSVVVPWDYDQDSDMDLFIGARVEQGNYPNAPESIFLENNGRGIFSIAWKARLGMVTHALTTDLDGDGRLELAVCGEWSPIQFFGFRNGRFLDISQNTMPTAAKGWWNVLHAADLDADGDMDLIAGNWGLNAQFKASDKEPVELYYDDFDGNGYIDPIMCYYIDGMSCPFPTRDEITDQIVGLRKKFVTYDSYANATLSKIFSAEQVAKSPKLEVNTLETMWWENKNGVLQPRSFPSEANFSPVHAILAQDFDHDGVTDILLAGNVEYTRIRIGRTDANYGCLLKGNGKGTFSYVPQGASGLNIRGAVRSIKPIRGREGNASILVGINNRAALILKTR